MDKDHPVPKKVKMCPQSTKKLDCPAMVMVSRRILFDDFVVSAVPVLLTSPLDIVNIIIYTPKNMCLHPQAFSIAWGFPA